MGTSDASGQTPSAHGLRCVVVAARYNEAIIAQMIEGASAAWTRCGGEAAALRLERVPGAFELPLAARQLAARGGVDAVVALGCVIRGDTAHFDFVAGECAHGLMRVMLDSGIPVSFGVLTTDTVEQAVERADPARLDKGGEAIVTAVTMARLLRRI
ncbi:MAG: 6,7-dimethyl-8-ribityllumazine synthase [Gammaproteobacteria bacterium]|nr:6,7-dimethyl-8-ribityllumazine synthase [Gammaproteobacteria bacterium]